MAFPIAIIAFIYASPWTETEPDIINGDPVTYQHEFVSISVPIWPIAAFLIVLNMILLALLTMSLAMRRSAVDA